MGIYWSNLNNLGKKLFFLKGAEVIEPNNLFAYFLLSYKVVVIKNCLEIEAF